MVRPDGCSVLDGSGEVKPRMGGDVACRDKEPVGLPVC